MTRPDEKQSQDNASAAALEAIGNAARAYAALAPSATIGASSFPPLTAVDASTALLMTPAAAFAAVAAAAAKQLASQGHQLPLHSHANAVAAAAPALVAALGAAPVANHGQMSGNATLVAASSLLPAAGVSNALSGSVALNQFLHSVGQQVTQAHAHAQAHQNLAAAVSAATAASAAPTPPPATSYSHSPTPTTASTAQPSMAAPVGHRNAFSAVANMAAAHAAATASSNVAAPVSTTSMLPNIQNWSLMQLEKHVNLLQQMKQPVPQSVALLLADARRKEEKRTAKRVANRKSASTSRARKKALVEEMTRTNARLRRQALILSLLPDLVIVISQEGEITFCSAQVERVLRHKIDDLVGADIRGLLIPASRTALGKLVSTLTKGSSPGETNGSSSETRRKRRGPGRNDDNQGHNRRKARREEVNGNVSGASSGTGGLSSGAAAVVSDQSFPLSVVKVDSKQDPASDENDNSDMSGSGGKEPVASSLSNSTTARSPSASLAQSGSGSDSALTPKEGCQKKSGKSREGLSSSDDSSSGSTDTRKANENLERNVRASLSKSAKVRPGHKDDVLGDSVTPNNALARLSSLQHYPETAKPTKNQNHFKSIGDRASLQGSLLAGIEQKTKSATNNENASDDSGYRESNDSREETSSSASESSNSKGRSKPMAPTCNVCLIREDLTSLWCEVTSSIRTRTIEDDSDSFEGLCADGTKNVKVPTARPALDSKAATLSQSNTDSEEPVVELKVIETVEILLCLRPIRDGGKVDESLRFTPRTRACPAESGSSNAAAGIKFSSIGAMAETGVSSCSNGDLSELISDVAPVSGSPRKRHLTLPSAQQRESAKRRRKDQPSSSSETEKSVVESLILMSHKPH